MQKLVWLGFEMKKQPVRREFSLVSLIFLGLPVLAFALHGNPFVLLMMIAFGGVYVMVFPCASVKSPSFEILLYLHEHPGSAAQDVVTTLGQATLLQDRLRDLSNERWIEGEKLTVRGKIIATFFHGINLLLRQPMGTG